MNASDDAQLPPGPLSLLAHVTYFDRSDASHIPQLLRAKAKHLAWTNDTTILHDEWTGWPNPREANKGLRKTDKQWRDHIFEALLRSLVEMEARYFDIFSRVHTVVDVNAGNGYTERLRAFARERLRRMTLEVRPADDPPSRAFKLPWKHRASMEAQLESFDWFLYKEDDILVPGQAMRTQVRLAEPLYLVTGRTLGFVRLVNASRGQMFFDGLRRRTPKAAFFGVPGLGSFAPPTAYFAGVWAYPRRIMRELISRPEWRAPQLQRDVRASAAAGFIGCSSRAQALGLRPDCPGLQQGVPLCLNPCIVHTANTYNLRVYHLAHCGKYYIKTPASATPFFGNEPLLTKLPGSKVNQYACVCAADKSGASVPMTGNGCASPTATPSSAHDGALPPAASPVCT